MYKHYATTASVAMKVRSGDWQYSSLEYKQNHLRMCVLTGFFSRCMQLAEDTDQALVKTLSQQWMTNPLPVSMH